MSADHKKPVVAFVMLAVLAAVVLGVQFRADAIRATFMALGPLGLGDAGTHGVADLPEPRAEAGEVTRRRTPSRDTRRHPLAGDHGRVGAVDSHRVPHDRGSRSAAHQDRARAEAGSEAEAARSGQHAGGRSHRIAALDRSAAHRRYPVRTPLRRILEHTVSTPRER